MIKIVKVMMRSGSKELQVLQGIKVDKKSHLEGHVLSLASGLMDIIAPLIPGTVLIP